MAGKVFFSVSMSLDSFVAPERRAGSWMGRQSMELQAWVLPLQFLRENLKLGEGGEEGRDNDIARETYRAHRRERAWASACSTRASGCGRRRRRSTRRSSS